MKIKQDSNERGFHSPSEDDYGGDLIEKLSLFFSLHLSGPLFWSLRGTFALSSLHMLGLCSVLYEEYLYCSFTSLAWH